VWPSWYKGTLSGFHPHLLTTPQSAPQATLKNRIQASYRIQQCDQHVQVGHPMQRCARLLGPVVPHTIPSKAIGKFLFQFGLDRTTITFVQFRCNDDNCSEIQPDTIVVSETLRRFLMLLHLRSYIVRETKEFVRRDGPPCLQCAQIDLQVSRSLFTRFLASFARRA